MCGRTLALVSLVLFVACVDETPATQQPADPVPSAAVPDNAAPPPAPAPTAEPSAAATAAPTPPPAEAAPACMRSPADIMTVIGQHALQVNRCLVDAQRHKTVTKATRTVDLDFVVLPTGEIQEIESHAPKMRGDALRHCVAKALKKVAFPPVEGGPCPINLPLNVAPPHSRHGRGK